MKLIINTSPSLRQRIYVKQNELVIYEGEIKSDDVITVDGVSDGRVEIGIGSSKHTIPLDVKFNSVVVVSDTKRSRMTRNIFILLFSSVFFIYLIIESNNKDVTMLFVALFVVWSVCLGLFLFQYRNKPAEHHRAIVI